MDDLSWFDQALAQHDYEITGTPKHWEATDEKKAADAKLKAVVQAEVLKARIDELKKCKRYYEAKATKHAIDLRIKKLEAQL